MRKVTGSVAAGPSVAPSSPSAVAPFAEWVAAGPAASFRAIRDLPLEQVSAFVAHVFETKAKDFALSFVTWLICGGPPNEMLQRIRELTAGKSTVCGLVWKSGDIAYCCKNCQFDDTCAICVSCFQNGDHTGHDYRVMRVGGGCCDCGDPQAWKPEGFCSHHKGASEDDDPSANYPPQLRSATTQNLLQSVLIHLSHLLQTLAQARLYARSHALTPEHEAENVQRASLAVSVIGWLIKLCDGFGDGMRRILCDSIEATIVTVQESPYERLLPAEQRVTIGIGERQPLLRLLVDVDHLVPVDASKALRDLYLKLLGDAAFKRKFAVHFANSYDRMAESLVRGAEQDTADYESLLGLSVQLLTVPNIAPQLAFETPLLRHLLAALYAALSGAFSLPSGVVRRAEMAIDHPTITHRLYVNFSSDLSSLLSMGPIAKYFVYNTATRSTREFVRILGLMQGMDANVRAALQHVEYESRIWTESFLLEMNFLPLMYYMASGFILRPDPKVPIECALDISLESAPHAVLSDCYRMLVARERDQVPSLDVDAVELKRLPWPTHDSTPMTAYPYDVATQPVSLHHPMHRLLARMLIDGASRWNTTASALLGLPGNDIVRAVIPLLEAPLRAHTFLAQVRASMWVRNGMSVEQKCGLFVFGVHLMDAFDLDVGMLQCCAALLRDAAEQRRCHDDAFVAMACERFAVANAFDWAQRSDAKPGAEQESLMAEEFLRFLLLLSNERGAIGHVGSESPQESESAMDDDGAFEAKLARHHVFAIRREVVHKLCLGPATHSQLLKVLPKRMKNIATSEAEGHGMIDEVLDKVAYFSTAEGLKQGTYKLKDELWATDFDPYYPRYSQRQREQAHENFVAYMHRQIGRSASSKKSACVPIPRLQNVPRAFEKAIDAVLGSRIALRMIYSVLARALHKYKEASAKGEGAASAADEGDKSFLYKDSSLSENLLNYSVHLLLFALTWHSWKKGQNRSEIMDADKFLEIAEEKEHEEQGDDDAAELSSSIFDLRFVESADLIHDLCRRFFVPALTVADDPEAKKGKSVLDLAIEMRFSPAFGEQHEALDQLLSIAQRCDSTGRVHRAVQRQKAKLATKSGGEFQEKREEEETEEDRQLKRSDAKERQRAILAEFAAKQKAFLAKSSERGDKGKEKGGAYGEEEEAEREEESSDVCVLCREGPIEGNPLGLIAFVQPSNRLLLARKRLMKRLRPAASKEEEGKEQKEAKDEGSSALAPLIEQLEHPMDVETPVRDAAAPPTPNAGAADAQVPSTSAAPAEEEAQDIARLLQSNVVRDDNNDDHDEDDDDFFAEFMEDEGDEFYDDDDEDFDEDDEEGQSAALNEGNIDWAFVTQQLGIGAPNSQLARLMAEAAVRRHIPLPGIPSSSAGAGDASPATSEENKQKARQEQRWANEIRRNIESTPGVHCVACSHLMHAQCRHKYCLTLMNQVMDDPMGALLSPINVGQGEFCCPLCTSVSNTLLPVATSNNKQQTTTTKGDDEGESDRQQAAVTNDEYDAWLARSLKDIGARESEEDEEKPNIENNGSTRAFAEAMFDFGGRACAAQLRVKTENVCLAPTKYDPFLWSLLASAVSNVELASRTCASIADRDFLRTPSERGLSEIFGADNARSRKFLGEMCEAISKFLRFSSSSNETIENAKRELNESIFGLSEREGVIKDPMKTEEEEEETEKIARKKEKTVAPFSLLSADVFAMFVRCAIVTKTETEARQNERQHRQMKKEVAKWMNTLHLAAVAQAILSIVSGRLGSIDLSPEQGKEPVTDARSQGSVLAAMYEKIRRVVSPLPAPSYDAIDSKKLEIEVKRLCLPFLRKAALFAHSCLGYAHRANDDDDVDEEWEREAEYSRLCSFLSVIAIDELMKQPADAVRSIADLVDVWANQTRARISAMRDRLMNKKRQSRRRQPQTEEKPTNDEGQEDEDGKLCSLKAVQKAVHATLPAEPFELAPSALPQTYQELPYFKAPRTTLCKRCGRVPKNPALCLLCGKLVCFDGDCCRSAGGNGECTRHAKTCGNGEGMFLILKDTIVLLLRVGAEGRFLPSPYLDAHGEEDQGLRRGRPLFLDHERLRRMRALWLDHQIASSVAKRRGAALALVQWHRM